MVRTDTQFPPKIKTMGVVPLHAGIEMKLIAGEGFRFIQQPIEKSSGVALLSRGVQRNEIVDIERLSPRQEFRNAIARAGDHLVIDAEVYEYVTMIFNLPLNLLHEIIFQKMGPELMKGWKAVFYLCFR